MSSTMKIFALMAAVFIGESTYAADKSDHSDRGSRIAMHEDMAKRHRQMADCLKKNKPLDECQAQAMKGCPMMKSGKCPFMGNGMMDHDEMMQSEDDKNQSR